ncbi:MAG TPA: DUF934 domain-containing protein [Ramlibacter sp.]|jgi:uncharacterized protein (DUF934 family)
MERSLDIISAAEHETQARVRVLQLANDADPLTVSLDGIDRVELHFPKFTDGRAYSQAWLIRRRRRFTGDIRATGDVLVDQLVPMQRTGFSSAVLKDGKDPADVPRQFERFVAYYQGDIASTPRFAEAA